MSQADSIRVRNQFIWWLTIPSLIILGLIIYLLVDKLGVDFGNSIAKSEIPELEQQAIELRLQPIGKVNVGEPIKVAEVKVDKAASSLSPKDQRMTKLIQDSGYACLGCHQVDTKLVGPSYREVAQKYQGDERAVTSLAEKIKAGGVGTWGQIPMPPNPTVSDEHMGELIDWILGLSVSSVQATPAATPPAPTEEVATTSTADSTEVLTTEQATALMSEKGYICMTCHQVEMKVVGPSYKDVAAKYAGDDSAVALLKEHISKGAVGTWGQIPMPANPTVTDDDLNALVAWVLSLK